MNRLDTAKMEISPSDHGMALRMIWGTYSVCLLAFSATLWAGSTLGANPIDRVWYALAILPTILIILDAWSAIVCLLRKRASTPLRIPMKTPVILAVLHAILGAVSWRLVPFEVLYELAMRDESVGVYEIRTGIAVAIVAVALLSLLTTVFEIRLVRWVLLSEITSTATPGQAPRPQSQPQPEEEDLVLGAEHLYEAQVLLNNLGHDVSQITGEMNPATVDALKAFQISVDLAGDGSLTAKTMIELRNRWREREEGGSPVLAVSEHVVRKTGSRLARLFKRS